MASLANMTLEELYAKGKITSAVEKYIFLKEDFSQRSVNWCNTACKLKCKNPPSEPFLHTDQVDVLIIQDHQAPGEMSFGRMVPGENIERKHLDIIQHIARETLFGVDGKLLSYSVTSMLKCKLDRQDMKKGKPPTTAVLQKCRPYLLKEIELRKPKVIISLSTAATKGLGLKKANSSNCGEITGYKGIPVIMTLHPKSLIMLRQNSSGAFWGSDFLSVIKNDFTKAAKVVKGELGIPDLDAAIERAKEKITVARSLEDVGRLTRELLSLSLNEKVVLSYDTETTSLDPYLPTAKIILMQFGFRRPSTQEIESYVFPMWHRENSWYKADEAWELIRPLLDSEEVKKIGHNIKFDVIYTYVTTGCRLKGILFDTMLLLHAINSGLQGMYGLKKSVWDWLPETELGGYEDKLPKLTKPMKEKVEGEEDGEGDESEGESEDETPDNE